jgi:predicted DNA-binding transcriptional regulator AlpA
MTTTKAPPVGGKNTNHDPYLAPAEVARFLGVSRQHAGNLMRNGTIPDVVDLSTAGERATLRVRRSVLAAWVNTRAL